MPTQTLVLLFVAAVLGLAVIVMLGAAFFTAQQRTTVIVQRLGKFLWEAGPGLHVKISIIDTVVGRINLRVQQLDVRIETKSVPGTTANDVMNLVLMPQHFDMLKEIGASSRTGAILIPRSPGSLATLTEQCATP